MNNYQEQIKRTFKVHRELSAYEASLLDWVVGLNGEAGEVTELIKHIIFGRQEKLTVSAELKDMKMELAKEIGDVYWYINALAATLGINMDDIAQLNLEKLNFRHTGTGFNRDSLIKSNRMDNEMKFSETPIYQILKGRITDSYVPVNIIFIGPDGSGKTTLSKAIAESLQMKYHKCNYEQENKLELAEHLLNTQTDVIYDRFYYPDELIYSTVKEGKLDMAKAMAFENVLIPLLKKFNVMFIYVTAPLYVLQKRSTQWKDDYVTKEDLQNIMENYNIFLSQLDDFDIPYATFTTGTIEVNSPEYKELLASIEKTICNYREEV